MRIIICISLMLCAKSAFTQPTILWNQNFGGSGLDVLDALTGTSDDGFIAACHSNSNDHDFTCAYGNDDVVLMKFNRYHQIEWTKCYGGSSNDVPSAIIQTQDRGYLFAAQSESNDGEVSGNHGAQDYWVVKLDSLGNIEWQKSLGGSSTDIPYAVIETHDRKYIVVGITYSDDGDVGSHHGYFFTNNGWIVKLDSIGSIIWSKVIGDSTFAYGIESVTQTRDGNYLVSGFDRELYFGSNALLLKLDTAGNIIRKNDFGGSLYEDAYSVLESSDGTYVFAGATNSEDGEVNGNHGADDYWLVKTDTFCNLIWQHCFGGSSDDEAYKLVQIKDKGFVIVGSTRSSDGQVTDYHGSGDYWIIKTDSNGNLSWQKDMGGSYEDVAKGVVQKNNGDFVVGGYSNSTDGDFTANYGGFSDIWLTELSINTGTVAVGSQNASVYLTPNSADASIRIVLSNSDLLQSKLRLYSIDGKLERELILHSSVENIQVRDLSNGLYLYSIAKDGVLISSGKLLILSP